MPNRNELAEVWMKPPPKRLGGADLLLWAPLDDRVVATGYCTHSVDGEKIEKAAVLTICVDRDAASGYYLFHCDQSWEVLSDTWHETIELAQRQAEAEYSGVSALWRTRG